MADPPSEPIDFPMFFWIVGGLVAIGGAALAWLRNLVTAADTKIEVAKVGLRKDLEAAKQELWTYNDDHGKFHVRADDIGLLRNDMQIEEARKYKAMEQMEGRIMIEIRTLQAQVHIVATELAGIKGQLSRRDGSIYGRSGGDGS